MLKKSWLNQIINSFDTIYESLVFNAFKNAFILCFSHKNVDTAPVVFSHTPKISTITWFSHDNYGQTSVVFFLTKEI